MRRRFAWLGAAAIALGIAVLVYRGPGRAIVRGHVGDVAATMLVYAALGAAWRTRRTVRATMTFAVAVAIELVQIGWHARSPAGELLIGSTFDPWDLVAYALGVAIAVGWDVAASRRGRSTFDHVSSRSSIARG
ncbi:MAG TPA: DUF2809 domain-containing protein [Kofleriaceae bacterium]|nr:DUF2809 domain-containing protein [Kofleriaceae bacterium]